MPTPMQFLRESGVAPMHRRGQNFLIDKNILKKIATAADIKKTDTILEIGSGSGELTCEIASRAKKVFAVEIDTNLFELLSERMKEMKNVRLFKDDIRAIPNTVFGKKNGSYSVVANIPYHITSQIVRKFLEDEPRPRELILLMQKEVAKRIVERPPNMNLLAVSVQYYADAKLLFPVSRNSFFPKPNVDSAVIRLVVKSSFSGPIMSSSGLTRGSRTHGSQIKSGMTKKPKDDTFFFSIVRAGFSAKRKQCAQSISKKLHISLKDVLAAFQGAGVAQKARAQEISVDQWEKIVEVLSVSSRT